MEWQFLKDWKDFSSLSNTPATCIEQKEAAIWFCPQCYLVCSFWVDFKFLESRDYVSAIPTFSKKEKQYIFVKLKHRHKNLIWVWWLNGMSSLPSSENNGKSWGNCCHILQLSVAGSLSDLARKQFWQFSPSGNHRGALDYSVMQKTGSVLWARLRRCIKKIPVPLITVFWLDKITVCQQVSVGLGVLSKLDFLAMFPQVLKLFQIVSYVIDAGTRLRHLTHSPSSVEWNRVS